MINVFHVMTNETYLATKVVLINVKVKLLLPNFAISLKKGKVTFVK